MVDETYINDAVSAGITAFLKADSPEDKMDAPMDVANEPENEGAGPAEEPAEIIEETVAEIPEGNADSGEDLFKKCTGTSLDEASEGELVAAIEGGLSALGL